jgi:hypothetical protein
MGDRALNMRSYLTCNQVNKANLANLFLFKRSASVSFIAMMLTAVLLFSCQNLSAWGGKGHAVICEAAIQLVKNRDLKNYLLHKTHNLAHLCNVPDIYWRNLEQAESGNATHYIEPDLVGANLEESPTSFKEFKAKYQGKNSVTKKTPVFSVEKEIGTLWWRADQFLRLAVESGKKLKTLALPEKKDDKNDEHPFNKSLFDMVTYMGLLGHFIGDAAQPLHNTYNYDGYENGHGGIHSYYEETVVVNLDPDLLSQVIKNTESARKELNLTFKATPIEKLKKLSVLAHKDLEQIWKLDPIEKKSVENEEKGMSFRKKAERPETNQVIKKFRPLIVKNMSRAAVLLAHFWDFIYIESQTPNLRAYKGYRFPFQPDFVELDYLKLTISN